ncbi:MAG TPA: hypothetical protein VFN44_19620 [Solirubrobacteraceae bacterium]|nr:hypothetical protein [Solirubrobacteraceae bacterium]
MLARPEELLGAWEAAARVPPPARGAAVLARAALAPDLDTALDMPVGRSAALAARAHAEAFGAEVEGVLRCPACGETLEVTLALDALASDSGGEASTTAGGLAVRAPTTRDLLAAAAAADAEAALLARCVRGPDETPVDPSSLGPSALAEVDAVAERLAGLAGAVVSATCPGCGAEASAPLDVGALLWDRVARAAQALLADVAELAEAYGWTEPDVLALTPLRRRAYLELARGTA